MGDQHHLRLIKESSSICAGGIAKRRPGEPGSAQQQDLTCSDTSHRTECGFSAAIPGFCRLDDRMPKGESQAARMNSPKLPSELLLGSLAAFLASVHFLEKSD